MKYPPIYYELEKILSGEQMQYIDWLNAENKKLRAEIERLRVYAPLKCDDMAQGQVETIVEAKYLNELGQENDTIRALLTTIFNNADLWPVPGGTQYTIDGELMRKIAEVVK